MLLLSCGSPEPLEPTGTPHATLVAPATGASYRGGDTLRYSGTGTDGHGDPLPGSALSWRIERHHAGLTEVILAGSPGGSGSVVVPATGPSAAGDFYRFYLRAVDQSGLADTVMRDVPAATVDLTLASVPGGRQVALEGVSHPSPHTTTVVSGMLIEIGTTSPQASADTTFTFLGWSDGGAMTHTVTAPVTNTSYTATFGTSVPARQPPVAVIATPVVGTLYQGGQQIQFTGSATDADGAAIAAGSLSWWAEFHHDGQVDAALPVTSGASGSLPISATPVSTSPTAFYRLYLRAVDTHGLVDTVFRDLQPQTIQLTLATSPAGRTVTLDGQTQTTPITLTAIAGLQRTLGAPSPQVHGDTTFTFTAWSDNGSQSHPVLTPATNTTYTASFGTALRPPPVAVIATPVAGTLYRGGQAIQFTGSATDADGVAIAPGSLSWWVEFRHDGQVDPFLAPVTGGTGSFTPSSTGSTSTTAVYRLYLRAVDTHGLVDTVYRDLSAQTTHLTLASTPQGRTITLDGVTHPAPLTVTTVVGVLRAIGTIASQVSGDTSFTFTSWSDGGPLSHPVSPPTADTTFTASFSATVPPRLPPVAVIANPVVGTRYQGGQQVQFNGSATDADGVAIAAGSLSWWAEFHHDGQVDIALPVTTGSSGTLPISATPVSTSPTAFYRLYLRAVDTQGLVDTVFRDLQPQTVQLTLATTPVGRTLTLDGQSLTAPITLTAVVGLQRTLAALSPQVQGDTTFTFASWSDGGAQNHTITTPTANTTYTATFTVTLPPPVATITSPALGATYHGGSVIQFSGSAVDGAGVPLPNTALSWWADFHHDTHTHPFTPVTAGGTGTDTIPTSGEVSANVFYRFYLRAVDERGVADTVFRDVQPEKIQLTIASTPAGRTITLDGQPQPAPVTVTAVVGIDRQLGAPSPQSSGDSTYAFLSWSDGGAQTHVVSTPASDAIYTATFSATGPANKPPTVSLTAPAAGSSWVVNSPVTVSATAADSDGTVQQVQFFDGASSIGAVTVAPYSVSWTPTVTGSHSLSARATDNSGAFTTSAAVLVTVTNPGSGDTEAPTVSLVTPLDGDQGLSGVITASATASDNVGVVGVEFQVDGVKIGEAITDPYTMALPNTSAYAAGVHQVRVRARDAAGNVSPWQVARVTFLGGQVPSGFTLSEYVTGLGTTATAMDFAPDGRLFICEQGGDLRVVKNGALLATPFVHVPTTADGERGLLGVTFDPDFGTNGFVYVYYTATSGGVSHNRVSRFTASGDVAVPGSEVVIVDLPNLSTANNHNGGAIHFGPDGKLYVAVGDNNTGSNAQRTDTLFGKLLRYDRDGSIPADNPGLGTGRNNAIWAMGLRNPFTFGFQPGTGRLFIDDVGEATWEEINEGVAGANYGWPNTEGATTDPAYTSPLFTYKHGDKPPPPPSLVTGEAVVGAAFYNPGTVLYPADYVGDYFFADYVEQWVARLDLAAGNGAVYTFAHLPNSVTDLAVGPDGALYALGITTNGTWGVLRFAH